MNVEDEIKDKLNLRTFRKIPGTRGGGCINEGNAYEADDGWLFVKKCVKEDAVDILTAELISLRALEETQTIKVPKPHCVVKDPGSSHAYLVMEFIEMTSLSKYQKECGQKLAALHLHNMKKKEEYAYKSSYLGQYDNNSEKPYVDEFGFKETTYCGAIALNNEWVDDWVSFYARNRLQHQINLTQQKFGDREIGELWSQLQRFLPNFFRAFHDKTIIQPSLLHGDLWSGNVADSSSEPVIFDPACFYGHNEFDLSISSMFGGFHKAFFDEYFKDLPKQPGFDDRQSLYQLFHYMNHWNHFGGGYKSQTLNLMKKLINKAQ